MRDANERLAALHSLDRQSVRSALIEERGRLCLFVCGLKPVMVSAVQSVKCDSVRNQSWLVLCGLLNVTVLETGRG